MYSRLIYSAVGGDMVQDEKDCITTGNTNAM